MGNVISLSTSQQVHYRAGISAAAFTEVAMREGLTEIHRDGFPAIEVTIEQLNAFGDVLLAEHAYETIAVLLRPQPRMLALLEFGQGNGHVHIAGDERGAVAAVCADLIAALRDPELDEDHVPVTFWSHGRGDPVSVRRRVAAPAWGEIRDHYAEAPRAALDVLTSAVEPGPGGLLLWHGEPGTGKSYALRALAREWHPWCDTHFITDPDRYLGADTTYLMDALLRTRGHDRRRWRLVVLEDSGELLAADARALAGQALSRLLNLTDGLLGTGLRALVLVTTNEPLRRLHPAVVRPGRAWAEVEFTRLLIAQACAVAKAHGIETAVDREMTIAELFALERGTVLNEPTPLGFAA